MLARVKEFGGDDDKLSAEHQQDIDIDIGIESTHPKLEVDQEFDQELKDCVEVARVSRRVLRRESLRESLPAWLRVQVCLPETHRRSFRVWLRVCVQVCLHAERECSVRALGNQLSVDTCDCEDARSDCPHQCCFQQGKCKCRQRQFHLVDANHIVDLWKTTNSCNGCRQGKTSPIVAIGEMRFGNQDLESKSHTVWSTWCKTWMPAEIGSSIEARSRRAQRRGLCDCVFPQYYANPGVPPLRRRTEREVRRDSCD